METARAQRRERAKLIRLTEGELAIITDRARSCGRPVACYIREAALGGKPKGRAPTLANGVIRDLARVATSLRRLHDSLSMRALPEAPEFEAAVNDVIELIRRIG